MLLNVVQAARTRHRTLAIFGHLGAFGLFLLAILDSSPLPTFGGPDILIVILVATRPNPWFEYGAAATTGSVIGAYLTFHLARRAGGAYLHRKFKRRKLPMLLKFFERWRTGALAASTAIPLPLPTSFFFVAAGASNSYSTQTYILVVMVCRAVRYMGVAFVAHIYGRHIIRVLRHPLQHWGWLLLLVAIFIAVVTAGILINRRTEPAAAGN